MCQVFGTWRMINVVLGCRCCCTQLSRFLFTIYVFISEILWSVILCSVAKNDLSFHCFLCWRLQIPVLDKINFFFYYVFYENFLSLALAALRAYHKITTARTVIVHVVIWQLNYIYLNINIYNNKIINLKIKVWNFIFVRIND